VARDGQGRNHHRRGQYANGARAREKGRERGREKERERENQDWLADNMSPSVLPTWAESNLGAVAEKGTLPFSYGLKAICVRARTQTHNHTHPH